MILSLILRNLSPLLVVLDLLSSIAILIVLWLWRQRRRTRLMLEACNLPTVFWTPRFLNYVHTKQQSQQKLKSSSITGILPRMQRLNGPFGMYGTVYGISTPVVHVAHPVPARCILMGTNNDISGKMKRRLSLSETSGASKAPAYNHFQNFSGNGVFTADGSEWKEKRASVIHCLLKGISNHSSPAAQRLEREANHAADSIIVQLQQQRQHHGSICENVVPILQRATVGLIYRYITHDDCSSPNNEKMEGSNRDLSSGTESASGSFSSPLSSLATPTGSASDETKSFCPADICPPNLLESYLASVTDIRMIILAQSRSFWFLTPRWVYRAFSDMYKEEEKTMGPIRAFAQRACERAQPGSPLALLQERPSHWGESATTLSQNMIDEAITLLFAGQDTSAATLSWTLHLLSLYPDVQERLAEEVRFVLYESNGSNRTEPSRETSQATSFTKKTVSKMPFLDAVIKESMRLYPVAPFVVRKLQHDVDVVEGTQLPSGAFCCIWIYGLHRNPQLWRRPNDFVPDRWIDASLRDAGQEMMGAYMPFAMGPRSCLGQPLANVILRIVLARIIHQYQFADPRLSDSQCDASRLKKDMQAGFTVLPAGGLKLSVTARANVILRNEYGNNDEDK